MCGMKCLISESYWTAAKSSYSCPFKLISFCISLIDVSLFRWLSQSIWTMSWKLSTIAMVFFKHVPHTRVLSSTIDACTFPNSKSSIVVYKWRFCSLFVAACWTFFLPLSTRHNVSITRAHASERPSYSYITIEFYQVVYFCYGRSVGKNLFQKCIASKLDFRIDLFVLKK